jgi:hypothetical protein
MQSQRLSIASTEMTYRSLRDATRNGDLDNSTLLQTKDRAMRQKILSSLGSTQDLQ